MALETGAHAQGRKEASFRQDEREIPFGYRYTGKNLTNISFPLGGIGSGSIGLAGNGKLIDWEIFNKPSKGSVNGWTHLAVTLKTKDKKYCKVLCGDNLENLTGTYNGSPVPTFSGFGFGPNSDLMGGFPHFKDVTFDAAFPIATLTFSDDDFTGKVRLTAFNPLIPLDADNSSLPAAFFEIEYENAADEEVEFGSFFAVKNPFPVTENQKVISDGYQGVQLFYAEKDKNQADYGDLTVLCDRPTVVQKYWYRGGWKDPVTAYWKELESGEFKDRHYDAPASGDGATVGKSVRLGKGERAKIRFVLSWSIPNNYKYWGTEEERNVLWKNYYATQFASSFESALYSLSHFDFLLSKSWEYAEEMFSQTLPPCVIDSASSTLSVLKSATVTRLEQGELYGFEGNQERYGSCEGSCQHVYNYAYALCFLFPSLERSLRDLEFDHSVLESGESVFRLQLPLGKPKKVFRACLDGQMGMVFKTYREWKLCGDDAWLKQKWDKLKLVLAYAWSDKNEDLWDENKDGVLEGRQHHTLDVELFGASSYLQSQYVLALLCGAEMAAYFGETDLAEEYRALADNGKAYIKNHLFNGEYFCQNTDIKDKTILEKFHCVADYWDEEAQEIKYQIGEGCEIDQMLGEWHAELLGIDSLFDKEQTQKALDSLYRYNFYPSMRKLINPWRLFSLDDDAGTVMCSYPQGRTEPHIPLTYGQETMTGFEYAAGALMIAKGKEKQGLDVISAVRNRYQGYNRNPWNEIECGSNYVRAMASFSLIPIYSGFLFDLPHYKIGFRPKTDDAYFRSLFFVGTGWGRYEKKGNEHIVTIKEGSLTLEKLAIEGDFTQLIVDGTEIPFRREQEITFAKTTAKRQIVLR